jgi:uncharacterized membrane protein
MKIKVRDQRLPLSRKTKKFKPLRLKNRILKATIIALLVANCAQVYFYFIK